MKNKIVSGLLVLGALCALLATSGCGSSSSSSNDTAPAALTGYYSHSAVFRNNTTLTSGYNGFGQLGTGTLDQREDFRPVNTLGHMDGVSVGADHTVAFQNNGAVYAWGSNQTAQLGNGGSGAGEHSNTPVQVEESAGVPLTGVVSAAAGFYHSLAATNGGTKVYAWGNNTWGQLGLGASINGVTIENFELKTRPTPVNLALPDGVTVTKVVAGNQFSLALLSDGTVWAWGDNSYGQLGVAKADTTNGRRSVPQQVLGLSTVHVDDIAAGVNFCLARVGGTVYAWGDNSVGQLGVDPAGVSSSPTPTPIVTLSGVTQIAAGAFHGLALTSDTKVMAWGLDFFGELGDNDKNSHAVVVGSTTTSASFTPVQVLTSGVGSTGTALANVVRIYAYGDSSFAETLDGTTKTLYVWGDNRHGQLGLSISTSDVGYLLLAKPVTTFFK